MGYTVHIQSIYICMLPIVLCFNGVISRQFDVCQCVMQGGVHVHYMYINQFLDLLHTTNCGFEIRHIFVVVEAQEVNVVIYIYLYCLYCLFILCFLQQ